MSLFARKTFSAAGYAAFRPSYPPQLYNTVLKYHKSPSPSGALLDIGCGHGVISRSLSPHFNAVTGIDPSPGMIKQATSSTEETNVTFRPGGAEDLSFLPDKSIDMVVAGQAAHWFDYTKAWPELARVVRNGGTLAFWGYKDNIFLGLPETNAIIEDFCYGKEEVAPGMESMLAYWEPGRFLLRDSLRQVVPPERDWENLKRLIYDPDRETSSIGKDEQEAAWQRKTVKLGEFEGYIRTFSAYIGWKDAHPEFKSRADGGEGDLADVMFDRLVAAVPQWKAQGEKWRDVEADAVWGTTIILAKKR